MSDPRFIAHDFLGTMKQIAEECGEVLEFLPEEAFHLTRPMGKTLRALGKALRWGWDSANPLLPPEQQEPNWARVRREAEILRKDLISTLPKHPLAAEFQSEGKDLVEVIERFEFCCVEKRFPEPSPPRMTL